MKKQHMEQLIKALELVQEKPFMFMYPEPVHGANFLAGFHFALTILGLHPGFAAFDKDIAAERGWDHDPLIQMLARNVDPSDISKELLIIETESWKRKLAKLEEDQSAE